MIIPNKKQKMLLDDSYAWWRSTKQLYEFGGLAGTGKSTIMMMMIERFGVPLHRVAAMAFIGQVAIVMRMKGFLNAKTCHSWLFDPVNIPKMDIRGNRIMDGYFNRPKFELGFESKILDGIDLILIDEGGSIPMWLRPHIMAKGIKVLVAGDLGQLPPVGDKPAFLYDKEIILLDEIMRQGYQSAIVYLAHRIRNGLPIHNGFYGDVLVVDRNEITDKMIYSSDIVLCSKNKTRDDVNNRVRHDLLGIRSDLPIMGEKMICRKNNWNIAIDGINLANGLCGSVTNMPGMHDFDGKTFGMSFRPNMLNTSFENIKIDYEYLTAPYERRRVLKNNRYSVGEKFEYAYATTIHSSQGSEYANGLILEETINAEQHSQLLYTALTRFRNMVILAKEPRVKYY